MDEYIYPNEPLLDHGGADDRGYTPEGKPAAKVLKDWLAKPAWEVRGN